MCADVVSVRAGYDEFSLVILPNKLRSQPLWSLILYQTSCDVFLFFLKLGCSTEEFCSDILAVFFTSMSSLLWMCLPECYISEMELNGTSSQVLYCSTVTLSLHFSTFQSLCWKKHLISLLIKICFYFFYLLTLSLHLVDYAYLLDWNTHNKWVAGYHQNYF